MEPFSNIDIAIEVLSRLPAKSLVAFKCTAKRWNRLLSDPTFLHIHDKRSKDIFGLLIQQAEPLREVDMDLVHHTTITETESIVENTFLDFLPEKVVLVASSNGVLCCRSCVYSPRYGAPSTCTTWKGFQLKKKEKENLSMYICNPTTREWVQIRPKEDDATLVFGLAFHPFCSSSSTGSSFQLVNLQHSGSSRSTYSFAIYSSITQKWEMSKEVFELNSYVHPSKVVFCNRTFHWLTRNNHILTFNVEKQMSKLLKVPGVQPKEGYGWEYSICLGESDGYFHYICCFELELNVWILRDYEKPAWELKYHVTFPELYKQHPSLVDFFNETLMFLFFGTKTLMFHNEVICNKPSGGFVPLAFYEDVLYAQIFFEDFPIISYDFKTGTLMKQCGGSNVGIYKPVCSFISFPYRVSLLPLSLPLPLPRVRHMKRNKRRRSME